MDLTSKDNHQSLRWEYINIMNSNKALAEPRQDKRSVGSANKQPTSHNFKNKYCQKG